MCHGAHECERDEDDDRPVEGPVNPCRNATVGDVGQVALGRLQVHNDDDPANTSVSSKQ